MGGNDSLYTTLRTQNKIKLLNQPKTQNLIGNEVASRVGADVTYPSIAFLDPQSSCWYYLDRKGIHASESSNVATPLPFFFFLNNQQYGRTHTRMHSFLLMGLSTNIRHLWISGHSQHHQSSTFILRQATKPGPGAPTVNGPRKPIFLIHPLTLILCLFI